MTFIEYLNEFIKNRKECLKCPLSGKTKVFYERIYPGSDGAHVLFFGINPGKQEAKHGRPFIGPSGRILRKRLEDMGFFNDFRVAMTNAILCSTPNEREIPDVEECVNNCKPLLREIVRYIKPKIFVPVGKSCCEFLFGIRGPIMRISGKRFGEKHNIIPLIHPAAIVYSRGSGDSSRIFDESLKIIREVIEGVQNV